jgi:hypothetical protein
VVHDRHAAGSDSLGAAVVHDPARNPEVAAVYDQAVADRIPPCVRQREQELVRESGRDRTVPVQRHFHPLPLRQRHRRVDRGQRVLDRCCPVE